MSYTFTNKPFLWNKTGSDPTTSEASLGLQGGMALPAAFVNQQWRKTYMSIKEIQDKIEDGTIGAPTDNLSLSNSIRVGSLHTTTATTNYAVFGKDNNTANGVFVCGRACRAVTASGDSGTTGDLFVVGKGAVNGARDNAFRVTAAGNIIGKSAYQVDSADYAEMFEWVDGNPDNEDRRGLFVTLDGEKIKLAGKGDYIAGIVSATPSVIGDAYTDGWQGKYVKDVFGANVVENDDWIISDDFDVIKDEKYISRLDRPEWSAVGLLGKLVVIDDGSCKVNGYCESKENGVATAAKSGYRVLSRIDENHIKILLK